MEVYVVLDESCFETMSGVVVGIFSSQEKADSYADWYKGDTVVDCWELDTDCWGKTTEEQVATRPRRFISPYEGRVRR